MNMLSLMRGSADLFWAWVTIVLSALVAAGYCVIAINWYFQSKHTSQSQQARRSLARLRGICLWCAVCGYLLYDKDMPWYLWRIYDVILLVLACRTWWFVLPMRGPGLVQERLAEATELEESALKYREIAEL